MATKKIQQIEETVIDQVLTAEPAPLPEVYVDPYLSDDYGDLDFRFPRIQTLRGEGNQAPCWFIPESQLDQAGWLDPAPQLTTYHFASGDKEDGLMILQPRMLVAIDSGLLAFDREATALTKRLVVAGDYNNIPEESKDGFGTVQYLRLYLVDKDNCPLAETPFGFTAKGATRATFMQHWLANCDEITRLHCRSLNRPFSRRNAVY